MAGAKTTAIAYTEKPMPRFSGGKASARIAWALGCRPPPPKPCNTRKQISSGRLGARPHRNELAVNSTTQVM